MNRRAPLLLLAGCFAALAACSFHPPPKPQYFVLDPGKPASLRALRSGEPPSIASISFVDVAAPFAADGFVYQTSEHRWEVDPYNQFLVSPADMLTSILRTWTRESGLFGEVVMPGAGGGHDYYIDCDVAEMYGDFQNPFSPTAVLTIQVQVFRQTDKGRVVVLQKKLTQSQPVAARTPSALVAAWNEALRIELNQLTRALAELRQ